MSRIAIDLVKAAPNIVETVYTDLAQPGVRQVGRAIGNLFTPLNTVLLRANERLRLCLTKNMEDYRKKLKLVPEENIIEVAPEIGTPILQRLTYVEDENLSEMFLNLLAAASNKDTVNKAHPSFVRIIDHLSPDEAMLLRHMNISGYFVWIEISKEKTLPGKPSNYNDPYFEWAEFPAIRFPENLRMYSANLRGLGLVDVEPNMEDPRIILADEKARHILEKKYKIAVSEQFAFFLVPKEAWFMVLTPYGQMFVDACTSHTEDPPD